MNTNRKPTIKIRVFKRLIMIMHPFTQKHYEQVTDTLLTFGIPFQNKSTAPVLLIDPEYLGKAVYALQKDFYIDMLRG